MFTKLATNKVLEVERFGFFNYYWQESGRAVSRSVIIWKLHLTMLGSSREPGDSEAKGSSSFYRNFL